MYCITNTFSTTIFITEMGEYEINWTQIVGFLSGIFSPDRDDF